MAPAKRRNSVASANEQAQVPLQLDCGATVPNECIPSGRISLATRLANGLPHSCTKNKVGGRVYRYQMDGLSSAAR